MVAVVVVADAVLSDVITISEVVVAVVSVISSIISGVVVVVTPAPTTTVRSAVPVFPAWSVALYVIVYVVLVEVSREISVVVAPLSNVVIPRLSFTLSVTVAPKSTYDALSSMFAGLLPIMVITGASVSAVVVGVEVVADVVVLSLNAVDVVCPFTIASMFRISFFVKHSPSTQIFSFAWNTFANMFVIPFVASASHSVIFANKFEKKLEAKD